MKRTILIAALVSAPLFGTAWTDRAEYDLVLTVKNEAIPQKQIALLDQWKAKYPKSELRQIRRELYLSAYQSVGNSAGMLDVSREMLADDPNTPVGIYWLTVLTPAAKKQSPELWDAAEKAARRLLAAKKTDQEELLAHRTLGWVRWQSGDYAGAEQELTAAVKLDAKSAELASWLGLVLGLEKRPEKQVPALWQLARASSVRQMNTLLEQVYTSYHGQPDGLDALKTAAAASPFPPDGFNIESAAVIAARRAEEELNRTNPELAAWLRIRKQLESPDGDKYFAETLKAVPLPKLKGTVVRCNPPKLPTEVVLSMNTPGAEEVTLKFDSPMATAADAGTVLEFGDAFPESFTRSPFGLTVMITKDKVSGWPEK
jgi:tetratricopeptide (TPR) repeat protein